VVSGRALRIVFFGTPAFAVPTLDALLASRHAVVGVVTQPDRPRGRGQQTSPPPVKTAALRAQVPVLQPARLKDEAFLAAVAGWRPDLGVVAAYGRILTDALLALPPLGLMNVHASLLPRYRGAAPVHRAVMAGDDETGVTIMRVVQALDAGPMLAVATRPIGVDETSVDVERDLASLGASLLLGTVDALAEGPIPEAAQDEAAATYAPRITREDGRVDWTRPALALHNQVRGLYPWPHAFTYLAGHRIILLRTRPVNQSAGAPPGTILEAHGNSLTVATGQGTLAVLSLQPEGRRAMAPRDFLAGHAVVPGTAFTAGP
jgi:methionyl-tRNA formyltransferase